MAPLRITWLRADGTRFTSSLSFEDEKQAASVAAAINEFPSEHRGPAEVVSTER